MNNYQVDREKWNKMGLVNQMANIYSEVGRTIKWRTSEYDFQAAFARALDLFSATTEYLVNTHQNARLKELLRSRDQFINLFFGDKKASEADYKSLEDYFMYFALAARAERFRS
jgi:hypothetical protein